MNLDLVYVDNWSLLSVIFSASEFNELNGEKENGYKRKDV